MEIVIAHLEKDEEKPFSVRLEAVCAARNVQRRYGTHDLSRIAVYILKSYDAV